MFLGTVNKSCGDAAFAITLLRTAILDETAPASDFLCFTIKARPPYVGRHAPLAPNTRKYWRGRNACSPNSV